MMASKQILQWSTICSKGAQLIFIVGHVVGICVSSWPLFLQLSKPFFLTIANRVNFV